MTSTARQIKCQLLHFNIVLCQLGLQFFQDKSLALHEMARVLSFGGRLLLSVFTSIERTPFACVFADALDRHLGESASSAKRAVHSFSDSDRLAQLAADAGLKNVVVVSGDTDNSLSIGT